MLAPVLPSLAATDAARLFAVPAHALVLGPTLRAVQRGAVPARAYLQIPALGARELAAVAAGACFVWPAPCAIPVAAAAAPLHVAPTDLTLQARCYDGHVHD